MANRHPGHYYYTNQIPNIADAPGAMLPKPESAVTQPKTRIELEHVEGWNTKFGSLKLPVLKRKGPGDFDVYEPLTYFLPQHTGTWMASTIEAVYGFENIVVFGSREAWVKLRASMAAKSIPQSQPNQAPVSNFVGGVRGQALQETSMPRHPTPLRAQYNVAQSSSMQAATHASRAQLGGSEQRAQRTHKRYSSELEALERLEVKKARQPGHPVIQPNRDTLLSYAYIGDHVPELLEITIYPQEDVPFFDIWQKLLAPHVIPRLLPASFAKKYTFPNMQSAFARAALRSGFDLKTFLALGDNVVDLTPQTRADLGNSARKVPESAFGNTPNTPNNNFQHTSSPHRPSRHPSNNEQTLLNSGRSSLNSSHMRQAIANSTRAQTEPRAVTGAFSGGTMIARLNQAQRLANGMPAPPPRIVEMPNGRTSGISVRDFAQPVAKAALATKKPHDVAGLRGARGGEAPQPLTINPKLLEWSPEPMILAESIRRQFGISCETMGKDLAQLVMQRWPVPRPQLSISGGSNQCQQRIPVGGSAKTPAIGKNDAASNRQYVTSVPRHMRQPQYYLDLLRRQRKGAKPVTVPVRQTRATRAWSALARLSEEEKDEMCRQSFELDRYKTDNEAANLDHCFRKVPYIG